MHSLLWASVGVSAGAAVVTTVLIDFLFKPGLEARKDRTTQARTLREVEPTARDLIAIMDEFRPTRSTLMSPSSFRPTSGPSLTGPPNLGSKQRNQA